MNGGTRDLRPAGPGMTGPDMVRPLEVFAEPAYMRDDYATPGGGRS